MARKVLFPLFLSFWFALMHSGSSVIVRLNGSNSSSEGRVEVKYKGTWGTICDDRWTMDNGNVVCRMLGHKRAFLTKFFGQGTGRVWLDEVSCSGSETNIEDCRHVGWGNNDCRHYEDVGVVCTNDTYNTSVRLVNSSLPYAGQLEIRYYGIWKPVCDQYWTLQDAHVACRMLNYTQGAALAIRGYQSSTKFNKPGGAWQTQIKCSGKESSLDRCNLIDWAEARYCGNDYRVAVVCRTGQKPDVGVRLVNGSTPNQGRVELRYYGVWGTVCDDFWTIGNAHVVCHMLNYSKALSTGTARYGGSGPILLDDVACSGFENSVEFCWKRGWGRHNCFHFEDVGVTCETGKKAYPDISVRLVNGKSPHTGQIQMRYYGRWKPVCDSYWTLQDAHVVCRMLNYTQGAALAVRGYQSSAAGDAWRTYIHCRGTESSISNCTHLYWGQTNCANQYRVGVACISPDQDSSIPVRLVDGASPKQGRVEVRYYGVWGTVCDDSWGLADAQVVCRMLNYSKASWAGTAKVKGTGSIVLDEVQCRGYEKSIEKCSMNRWGLHDCSHYEDAGITCENLTKEELNVTARLIGNEHKNMGFVEVNYKGTWIPVCNDTWDILDAHVICKMLGYKAGLMGIKGLLAGKGGVWMGGLECGGDEKSVSECYHRGWSNKMCPGNFYAGVICGVTNEHPPVGVRLEEGSSPNTGRVALRYGNVWGTICGDELDINGAKVICRMLGYPGAHYTYSFRAGRGAMWLMYLKCSGTENSIADCRHGWGNFTACSHDNDAAIMCKKAEAPRFKINGTTSITSSTVDICFKASLRNETQLKSVYQVAVEKPDIEKDLQFNGQIVPYVFDDVTVTMGTSKFNNSYIAAEITSGSMFYLTIGDGQYYHGYYNAPLEPGCRYRIYLRSVTKTVDKKPIYSATAFVTFTTKEKAIAKKVTSGKMDGASLQRTVIGLSFFIVILILIIVGFAAWSYLNKKKDKKKMPDTSGINATEDEPSGFHYQSLRYPSARGGNREGDHQNQGNADANAEVSSAPHYQPLSRPSAQQGNFGGESQSQANREANAEQGSSGPHYQHLNRPSSQQRENEDQNQPSGVLKRMYKGKKPETQGARNASDRSSDFGGIENQVYNLSDIRLQELDFNQMNQEN